MNTDSPNGGLVGLDRRPWWLIGTVAMVVFPMVLVIFRAGGSGWEPSGDHAMEVLRMHDTGGRHTPLLGAYSRFGWNHPGPLLFWIGAPALKLAGPVGVMVSVGVINVAALVGAVWSARRLGGNAMAVAVAVGSAVLVHNHGVVKLVDIWNPWVAVLPLLCFLFTVPAAVIHRSAGLGSLAIVTGSFAAQSHLGNVPVVGAATAGGLIWLGTSLLRERRTLINQPTENVGIPASHRRVWLTGAGLIGLLLALWSGPMVDQIIHDPGNVVALARFTADNPEEPAPLKVALGAAARELGFRPAWTGAPEAAWPVNPAPIWTLALIPMALVAGTVATVRRPDLRISGGTAFDRAMLPGQAALVFTAAVFAVTRTTGGLIPYVLRWSWPVALFTTVVAAAPVTDWLTGLFQRSRGPMSPKWVTITAATLILTIATAGSSVAAVHDPVMPTPMSDPTTRDLSRSLRDVLPPGSYRVRWLDVRLFSAASIGVAVNLTRNGYDIDFPTDHGTRVGQFRARHRTDLPLLMIIGQTPRHHWEPPAGARQLVHWDHLSPADRARADQLERTLRRDTAMRPDELMVLDTPVARQNLLAAGADPATVDALHQMEADREWYEVWLLPPGSEG